MKKLKGTTVSERVFELYLRERKVRYRYEKKPKGIKKPTDYSFKVGRITVRSDVKEWEPAKALSSVYTIDGYGPIRAKIEEGRRKFKEYKKRGEPCCLVLHHYGQQLILLGPLTVFGAMLGDFGLVFPLATDGKSAFTDDAKRAFLGGGKMAHKRKPLDAGTPQNTTISAIIVADYYNVRGHLLAIEVERRVGSREKRTPDEIFHLALEVGRTLDAPEPQTRVAVYDNPFARNPLPAGFPTGAYDERYALQDGHLVRVYAGSELLKIEAAEKELDIYRPDLFLGR